MASFCILASNGKVDVMNLRYCYSFLSLLAVEKDETKNRISVLRNHRKKQEKA